MKRFMQTISIVIMLAQVATVQSKDKKEYDGNAIGHEAEESVRYSEFLTKGAEYEALGDIKSAIIFYTKAIEANEKSALAYDRRAVAFMKSRKFHKAAKDLITALEIDPNFAEAYMHIGIIHHHFKSYSLALECYAKAIDISPEMGKIYYNRSLTFLELNDVEAAYADLILALKNDYFKAEEVIWEYCSEIMLKKNQLVFMN